MSQETNAVAEAVQIPLKEKPKQTKMVPPSTQELLDSLKSVQDDIGQICELMSEERVLVTEFFESFLKLMQPFAATLPVSATTLPEEIGQVVQAYVDPMGHLMLLYQDGHAEIENLREEENRDLMIAIIKDVMPKFKQLTNARKQKIEERMKFMSSVAKELQKISRAFSAADADESK